MPDSPSPEPVTVELDLETIEAIERFVADESGEVRHPEAIRLILRDWLIGHGYLAPDRD